MEDDFWKTVSVRRSSSRAARTGALNIALLFGTAAVALSLIITPMLAGKSGTPRLAQVPDPYDNIVTGSINRTDARKNYSIRRSILQDVPGSVCIVEGYSNNGNC